MSGHSGYYNDVILQGRGGNKARVEVTPYGVKAYDYDGHEVIDDRHVWYEGMDAGSTVVIDSKALETLLKTHRQQGWAAGFVAGQVEK